MKGGESYRRQQHLFANKLNVWLDVEERASENHLKR